jgi:plastocyanin
MISRYWLQVSLAGTFAVALSALVVALRADGGGSQPPGAEAISDAAVPDGAVRVQVADFTFQPDPVRVQAGAPVAWANQDKALHNVAARDGSWRTKTFGPGESVALTFDEPGTYGYICELHPPAGTFFGAADGAPLVGGGGHGMQGTIIVE